MDGEYVCLVCEGTSRRPKDIANGYCPHCHKFDTERMFAVRIDAGKEWWYLPCSRRGAEQIVSANSYFNKVYDYPGPLEDYVRDIFHSVAKEEEEAK